ncbi:MAG: hypothetical protein V4558_13840 [Gemmatimonadota bacterium]
MTDSLELLAFLGLVVGLPLAIGWLSGKRVGGRRGKLVGALIPVAGWTIRFVYNMSLPRSYDYGPEPKAEIMGWIGGSVVAGVIGVLAAGAFDCERVKRPRESGTEN